MKLIFNSRVTLLIIGVFTAFVVRAQNLSQATNIRIATDEKKKQLIIQYDLLSKEPGDSLYVEIETASRRRFRPTAVTGNVGKTLSTGRDKTIYWDIVRDNVQLDEEVEVIIQIVRPAVITRPTANNQPQRPVSTPAVTTPKKSVLPVIGWVATGGLAVYAFTLSSGLNKDVAAYNQNTVAATLAEWNNAEAKRSDIDSRQKTFTAVAGATALLAVANVAWLVVRKSKQSRTTWNIQPNGQAVQVGFVRSF